MKKKYAIVTGASSGIGYEMAGILAEMGYSLIIVARRKDRLEELKKQLVAQHNATVEVLALDLSHKEAAITLFNHTQHAGFDVEILINNAGFGIQSPFLGQNAEKMAEMMQLNIITLTHLTQLYAQYFAQKGGGKILQVASGAAFLPTPYLASYAGTKAYVLSFSEAIRFELRNSPVSITTLYPGYTATEFGAVAEADVPWLVEVTKTSAKAVAEAGIKGMLSGKKRVIPGYFNKMSTFFTGIIPRRVLVFITGRMMESLEKE